MFEMLESARLCLKRGEMGDEVFCLAQVLSLLSTHDVQCKGKHAGFQNKTSWSC